MSTLNSTSTPLLEEDSWSGSLELCKAYSAVSVSILADTACTVSIIHLDKNGNVQYTDSYTSVANIGLYKACQLKSTHFKVSIVNLGVDQTVLRLVTRLLNSSPDDMNVTLTIDDVITAKLSTSQGAVDSSGGKLLVYQNALSQSTDGVKVYGLDSGTPVAMKVGSTGVVSVSQNVLDVSTDSVKVYGYDGSTNRVLSTDNTGALNVNQKLPTDITSYTYHNSSLETTPISVSMSQRKLMFVNVYNDAAQFRFIRLYDAISAPVSTDVAKLVLAIKQNSFLNVPLGMTFLNGIYVCGSSVWGASSASYGSINTDELLVNLISE